MIRYEPVHLPPLSFSLTSDQTKCNYVAVGLELPLQFSLATWSPANTIYVANVVNDLRIRMGNSFSPSIH